MNVTQIPPPRVPLTDPRTGMVSREWYAYLINRDLIIGGGSGATTINELSVLVQRSGSTPGADGEDGEDGQIGLPGPQGQIGAPGLFVPGMDGQDGEDSALLVFPPNRFATVWSAFTPTRTGWTDVGAPTVTGRKCQIDNVCFFQVKVVPGVTVATVAGTSYVALPVNAAGLGGDASMQDLTTFISIGNCVIDVANSRVYVPAQAASADSIIIAGWYEA